MGDPAADYAPPITFMVVQKRHHTRFFPSSPQAGDRSGNIPPGARMIATPASYSHISTKLHGCS